MTHIGVVAGSPKVRAAQAHEAAQQRGGGEDDPGREAHGIPTDQRDDLGSNRVNSRPAVTHVAVHVGQAEVAAGVAVDEPGVVDAHEVQDRGVVVVDVHGVRDDVDAELVGLAERACPP